MTTAGAVSRHEFAEAIFAETRRFGHPLAVRGVTAISTDELQAAAPRPKNSRLSLVRLAEQFGIHPPHWRTPLNANYIAALPRRRGRRLRTFQNNGEPKSEDRSEKRAQDRLAP